MITPEINIFLGFFHCQKSLSKFIFCSNHFITKNTGNHNIYSAVERGRLWLPRRTAQPEGKHTAQRRVNACGAFIKAGLFSLFCRTPQKKNPIPLEQANTYKFMIALSALRRRRLPTAF